MKETQQLWKTYPKKRPEHDLRELQVRKSWDLGRESRWESHEWHRKTAGKTGRQGFLEMVLGLQLWWGSPENPPAGFFGSQEGKGWGGCVSRKQEKMVQKMQFKQKNKRQRGPGKMWRFWVTLSFIVSCPCAKSAHEQSTFAGLCTELSVVAIWKCPSARHVSSSMLPQHKGWNLFLEKNKKLKFPLKLLLRVHTNHCNLLLFLSKSRQH